MFTADFIGILLALSAATVWGSADFSGGLATRRHNQYLVLLLSALSGLVLLVIAALVWREAFPDWQGVFWSVLAGLAGLLGISSLYKGLSIGKSAMVAPTAAVIGASLPVAFSFLTEGLPAISRLIGFGLAFIGIWIVSQSSDASDGNSRKGFLLAVLAGLGFAGFYIFISSVDGGIVFTPLIVSRLIVVLGAVLLIKINTPGVRQLRLNRISLLAGVLDATGNILFLLARQFTRLDMAVVLSSLYPAGTVMLAAWMLKEKISLKQWVGVITCLAAIILITLT